MLLSIEHETRLNYSEPVAEHVSEVRMAPLSDDDQTTLGFRLRVTPATVVRAYRDGFSNRVDLFNHLAPCQEVVIRATSFVRTQRRDGRARLAAVAWPGDSTVAVDAVEYLHPSQMVNRSPELERFLANLPRDLSGSLADVVENLLDSVHQTLKPEKNVTNFQTKVSEALHLGRGVCQDFSHLFIAACRGTGLPARYVSGYINMPGELATHAWSQVWGGESVGWVDVDPIRRRWVDDDYVVTAVGRDYADVPPNRGVWKGTRADETIEVLVKVQTVSRLPADWLDIDPHQVPRHVASALPSSRFQRTNGNGLSNQVPYRAILRHQKSQQQQELDSLARFLDFDTLAVDA